MKVAVPVFAGRISPVFDWAGNLLIVEHDGDLETGRREMSLDGIAPFLRARHLVGLGVQTLICGGISAPVAAMVESHGVRLIPGVVGELDAVLGSFFAGKLPDPTFAMPGWRGCGHPMGAGRMRRGRRQGGGRGGGGRGRRGQR